MRVIMCQSQIELLLSFMVQDMILFIDLSLLINAPSPVYSPRSEGKRAQQWTRATFSGRIECLYANGLEGMDWNLCHLIDIRIL